MIKKIEANRIKLCAMMVKDYHYRGIHGRHHKSIYASPNHTEYLELYGRKFSALNDIL